MTITLKGIYRDGKIELAQKPAFTEGAEVTVTIESPAPMAGKQIHFGMFSGPAEKMSTEADFEAARRSIWGDRDAH